MLCENTHCPAESRNKGKNGRIRVVSGECIEQSYRDGIGDSLQDLF